MGSPFTDGIPRQAESLGVLSPSTVYYPPSIPRSAVRGPRSEFVYSFPHSLTAHFPDRLESLSYRSLQSEFVHSFPIR